MQDEYIGGCLTTFSTTVVILLANGEGQNNSTSIEGTCCEPKSQWYVPVHANQEPYLSP